MTDRYVYVCTKNSIDDPGHRQVAANVSMVVAGGESLFDSFIFCLFITIRFDEIAFKYLVRKIESSKLSVFSKVIICNKL